ncbi:metallophosphoesterase [Deinococcus apachensis]|uniref:metallophosphoesterase n=1 Tax=Deinococcus apachensis TaxID=309886 RepID=UPI00036CAFA5|nr:metallophosphoesterase [Deinococcus apachensis]
MGDIHGCIEELLDLLNRLGYVVGPDLTVTPPAGHRAVFLGDLGDRGPDTPAVYRLVMGMVDAGQARCVIGNHDEKLRRKLAGHRVSVDNGLALTLDQLFHEPMSLRRRVRAFLEGLPSHLLLDHGRLVVAHVGLKQDLQGRKNKRAWAFAVYGDTTGERDEFGLPVRRDWAAEYHGPALVVYGHTPVPEVRWLNRTVNIDTGCVFGGKLTALRYSPGVGGEPDLEVVSVPARRTYWVSPSFPAPARR